MESNVRGTTFTAVFIPRITPPRGGIWKQKIVKNKKWQIQQYYLNLWTLSTKEQVETYPGYGQYWWNVSHLAWLNNQLSSFILSHHQPTRASQPSGHVEAVPRLVLEHPNIMLYEWCHYIIITVTSLMTHHHSAILHYIIFISWYKEEYYCYQNNIASFANMASLARGLRVGWYRILRWGSHHSTIRP